MGAPELIGPRSWSCLPGLFGGEGSMLSACATWPGVREQEDTGGGGGGDQPGLGGPLIRDY